MQQIKSLNQLQEELHRQQLQLAGIVLQEVLKAKKPRKDDEKQGIEVEIKKIVSDIAYLTFISEQETRQGRLAGTGNVARRRIVQQQYAIFAAVELPERRYHFQRIL